MRDILQENTFCISKCGVFFLTETKAVYGFYLNILTETFLLNLYNFSIAENANIVGTAF